MCISNKVNIFFILLLEHLLVLISAIKNWKYQKSQGNRIIHVYSISGTAERIKNRKLVENCVRRTIEQNHKYICLNFLIFSTGNNLIFINFKSFFEEKLVVA